MHLKSSLNAFAIVCLLLCLASGAHAQFNKSDDDGGYARSHTYDVLHTTLRVSFDEPKKMVIGDVTHTIVPRRNKIDTIVFDAPEIQIQDINVFCGALFTCDTKVRKFWMDTTGGKLIVHIYPPPQNHETLDVRIRYTCVPRKGLYFIAPDSSHPNRPHQIWSQGEGEDNRYWIPCYDYPNDKASTEVYATVPAAWNVISNGGLLGRDEGDSTITWHYKEYFPHSSYLITLVAGEFELASVAGWHDTPVQYWTWKGRAKDLDTAFKSTPRLMEFFSNIVDFPYPWEKYAQVPVAEFMYGGMENTSATTLFDGVLHDKRAQMDYNAMGLIAHELAHQWWGDVVTCRQWRDLWLNEGFATYFQILSSEHLYGRDRYDFEVLGAQRGSVGAEKPVKKPIVTGNGITTNTYSKGAAVLHMLRKLLGDVDFFKALHVYIDRHQYGCVTTEDLKIAIEDATGLNLHEFFDEWVYKAGHPVFDVSYSWDPLTKRVTINVAQTQQKDSLTGYFVMPVDVEINSATKKIVQTITVRDSVQSFIIDCPQKPLYVVFDKGNGLIKEVHFNRWMEEVITQLERGTAIERGLAAAELKNFIHRDAARTALGQAASTDGNLSVRQEAMNVLGDCVFSDVIPVLARLTNDPDPRIRVTAVENLGKHRYASIDSVLRSALTQDSSYAVIKGALNGLVHQDSTGALGTFSLLAAYADSASYRDGVRVAALNGMRTLKDKRALPYALKYATDHYVRDARTAAIAILEDMGAKHPEAGALLQSCLKDKSQAVRGAAASALGKIGNADALPALKQAISLESFDGVKETMRKSIDLLEHK